MPEARRIGGYAARFNSLSQDLGGFVEKIAPSAFAKSLLTADVRCLFNHDANIVLGRTLSKTLRIAEDSEGLLYECDMPDTQMARDMVLSPIQRGDVSQCSFGFYTIRDSWEIVEGRQVRTLHECELLDVSPVTYPAYLNTDVAARSMAAATVLPMELWKIAAMRRRLDLSV
jgi:HK97 family phage prohead protease